jgi:hypothetical protein
MKMDKKLEIAIEALEEICCYEVEQNSFSQTLQRIAEKALEQIKRP